VSAVATPSAPPPAERPAAVTVIGWVWIVYGVVKLLGGLWGLFVWRFGGVREFFAGPGIPAVLPASLAKAFGGFGVAVTVQIVYAFGVLVAASALLRRRPWARVVIEVLCWIGLCYVTIFAAGWIWAWQLTAFDTSRPRFLGLSIALGAVVVLGFAFISMIRALRSDGVRRALRGGIA
jgi:hypothetical protein